MPYWIRLRRYHHPPTNAAITKKRLAVAGVDRRRWGGNCAWLPGQGVDDGDAQHRRHKQCAGLAQSGRAGDDTGCKSMWRSSPTSKYSYCNPQSRRRQGCRSGIVADDATDKDELGMEMRPGAAPSNAQGPLRVVSRVKPMSSQDRQ